MATELTGHELSAAIERLLAHAAPRNRAALSRLTETCVAAAKRHVREGGAHAWGTPTPAQQGSGPAVISGDLARSVGSMPIAGGEVLTTRVGPRDTPHRTRPRTTNRPSRRRGRALSSGEIGEIVETKLGYPFMAPAARDAAAAAETIFRSAFEGIG